MEEKYAVVIILKKKNKKNYTVDTFLQIVEANGIDSAYLKALELPRIQLRLENKEYMIQTYQSVSCVSIVDVGTSTMM